MAAPDRAVLAGRYRLDALIAHGGMADVHRATDLRLEREVAVKLLRDGRDAARFDGEVETLAALDHPRLVRLLDAGAAGSRDRFLVLELRDEPTLAARLRAGPLTLDQTARVASDVADALAYVHARGIVHRDVKPANVFVDEDFHALLADFGVAKIPGTMLTAAGTAIGTAAYLAPEQVEGRVPTSAVDIYALGLVALECLTGRRAFTGTSADVAVARLGRDPIVPTSLPAPWRALLGATTARDPSSRPTAAAVVSALAALRTPDPVPATAPLATAPVARPPLWRRPIRRTAVLGAAAAVTVGTVAGVLLAGRGDGGTAPPPTTTAPAVTTTVAAPPPTPAPTVVVTSAPPATHRPRKGAPKGDESGKHADHRDARRRGDNQDGQAG